MVSFRFLGNLLALKRYWCWLIFLTGYRGHGTLGEAEKPRKLDFPDAFEPVKVECAGAVLLILARRKPLPPKKKDHSKSPTIGGGNVSQRNDFQNNGFSNDGFSGKQSFSDTFAPAQQTSYYDDQHDDNDPKSK